MQAIKERNKKKDQGYKRFMFNRRFDQTEGEVEHACEEIADILNTGGTEEQQELEDIITQKPAEPEAPPEPVYIPPTFTQEQLDAEIAKAREEGLEAGRKEMQDSLQQSQLRLQEEIAARIGEIAKEQEKNGELSRSAFISLNEAVLGKLMPRLEREHGFGEIRGVLEEVFRRVRKEPELHVCVNPAHVRELKRVLEDIGKKAGFSGKIVIEGKEDFTLSDIRIEWKDGGMERDASVLAGEIDNVLALYKGAVPGKKEQPDG